MNNSEITKEEQRQAHKDLLNFIENLYVTKNNAYGNSFTKMYEDIGLLSAATQIAHKYHRFINLARSRENGVTQEYEDIRDTLIDLANYCLLTVMEYDKEQKTKNDTRKQVVENESC